MKRILLLWLLGLGLLLDFSHAASALGGAQPGVFRQTNLDAGGWLTGFASHSGGRLYARTDVGGVYRSDDRGDTWSFLSGELPTGASHCVQGLAAGETSADIVFQAVGRNYPVDSGRGVWRSTDGGASWSQVLTSVNFSGNDDLRLQGGVPGDRTRFAGSGNLGRLPAGRALAQHHGRRQRIVEQAERDRVRRHDRPRRPHGLRVSE